MSECSICGEYSEETHPVDFRGADDLPKELEHYIGIGSYLDDTQASAASEEFWDNCAHLCPTCFKKYYPWIVWWG